MDDKTEALRVIRRSEAARIAGVCTRTLQRRELDDPSFPKPVALSKFLVGYRLSEFVAYLDAQPSYSAAREYRAAVARAAQAKKRREEASAR